MKLTVDQAMQQGITAHNTGNLQEAERLYRLILQVKPMHPDANHNLGLIAVAMNMTAAALPLFKIATDASPKIQQFWFSYIDALIKDKYFDDAKRAIKKGSKRGLAKVDIDAFTLQLKRATRDVLPIPMPPQATLQKLLKQYQDGFFDEAVKLAISLTKQFPTHQFSWKVLGGALKHTGKIADALVASQKSVDLNTNDNEAYHSLGVILVDLGRFDEAAASYRKSITLKADNPEVHFDLGFLFEALGRVEEAQTSYERALVLRPDYGEARYQLALFLFLKKDYKNAAQQFKLMNIHESSTYALRCSYLLDEQSVFYDRLDSLINQGKINPAIGSLICRSEIRYGTNKPNPFCNDPLRYVFNTNLNEGCDFENTFVEVARNILKDNSVSYKRQGHLTNGKQTAGNLFATDGQLTDEIKDIIHAEIDNYREKFKDSEEGFIKNWPADYSIYGWLVSMQSGGELSAHMHDTGWITGSIYINVPPKSKLDSGNLVLCIDDEECELGVKKNQKTVIDVVTGSLCFFPSSLLHYTIPFEAAEERIVLAFDIMPKKK
jgi:tetratricopeptide (TPR) repeat protein